MTVTAQNLKDKEVRGRILKVLNTEYPAPLSLEILMIGLRAARYPATTGQIKVHLAYLAEKGYIKTKHVGVADMELSRDMIALTAAGKDLVEGNIPPDVGVIIYAT